MVVLKRRFSLRQARLSPSRIRPGQANASALRHKVFPNKGSPLSPEISPVVKQGGTLSYMPQLDALRALAVGLVFLNHWGDKTGVTGMLGVRLFFVISGFLITSILLGIRTEIETKGTPWTTQLRLFYSRRFLRLFPALLLLVVVLLIFNWESIRHTWGWHLSYLSNVYFARRGEYEGPISVLWSLSVEEQFYLAWPLLILVAPRRVHVPAAIALVVTAFLWRLTLQVNGVTGLWTYVLPFKWLDGIGLGALLSLSRDPCYRFDMKRLMRPVGLVGVASLVGLLSARITSGSTSTTEIFLDLAASVAFMWIVACASTGIEGWAGRLLRGAAILYLGRISYGLYLYHAFVPNLMKSFEKRVGIALTPWDVPVFLYDFSRGIAGGQAGKLAAVIMIGAYSLIAVGVASVSWFTWERPLTGLRKYIRYEGIPLRNNVTS
jgi:peptidoglycan/LPS O-acetylase OafA/YrhL